MANEFTDRNNRDRESDGHSESYSENESDSESCRETNLVELAGYVDSGQNFSHEVYGEKFYMFMLSVPRLSEQNDRIPILYSERLVYEPEFLAQGTKITVSGQFRSYNNTTASNMNRLLLTVFARDIHFAPENEAFRNVNAVFLDGYICKAPIYRTTPFGREIADILIAVNRSYNKSDYIPCIAWGRNARYCEKLTVGTNIKVWGRIQSRAYQKKAPDNETITRTAYEISVARLELPHGR